MYTDSFNVYIRIPAILHVLHYVRIDLCVCMYEGNVQYSGTEYLFVFHCSHLPMEQ